MEEKKGEDRGQTTVGEYLTHLRSKHRLIDDMNWLSPEQRLAEKKRVVAEINVFKAMKISPKSLLWKVMGWKDPNGQ